VDKAGLNRAVHAPGADMSARRTIKAGSGQAYPKGGNGGLGGDNNLEASSLENLLSPGLLLLLQKQRAEKREAERLARSAEIKAQLVVLSETILTNIRAVKNESARISTLQKR